MTAKRGLRVVDAGETKQVDAEPVKPKTVSEAAAGGDRLDLLVAMRTRIATAVADADTPARDLAALTRRLLEIAKEIDVLKLAKAMEVRDGESREDQPFDASAI